MKFSLPIVSVALGVLLPATIAVAQSTVLPRFPTAPQDGHELVATAAAKMLAQPALEARIRQRSELFGRRLVGTGVYRQLGAGSNMARLELKLSAGGQQVASLLQVCDGQYVYVRRDHPDRTDLSQINLGKVRRAIELSHQPSAFDSPTVPWMAMGGLANLLRGLDQNFQFEPPRAAQYRNVPVWIVRGSWKREVLQRLLGDQSRQLRGGEKPDLNQLPPHLPHQVVLTLGRDQLFPLFPYRIEYCCPPERNKKGVSPGALNSIMTLELFEVHRRPDLTPEFFQYKPGDQEVVDRTEQFIASLRLRKSSE